MAAAQSGRSLSRRLPRLKIGPTRNNSLGWDAWTTGSELLVSRDCLAAPSKVRRYLLAHELGHIDGRHSAITGSAGMAFAAPLLWTFVSAIQRSNGHSTPDGDLGWALAAFFAAGFAILFINYATMLFEWSADRRGAGMIGAPAMITGIKALQKKRNKSDRRFYANKIYKLRGRRPPARKPP